MANGGSAVEKFVRRHMCLFSRLRFGLPFPAPCTTCPACIFKKSPKQEAHSAIHGAANGGLCGEIHSGSRLRQLAT